MSLLRTIERVRAQFADRAAVQVPPQLDVAGRSVLLVYLFDGMGDAVLLAPAVRALLEAGAQVGLLVPPLAARIWARIDLQVVLHVMPKVITEDDIAQAEGRRKRASAKAASARRELSATLKAAGYDVAADLTLRGGLDSRRWLDAGLKVGWTQPEETAEALGLVWGPTDTRTRTDVHWALRQIEPLACLGLTSVCPGVDFSIPAGARRTAEARFGAGPRLLVVPGSRSADKQWAASAFASVARSSAPGSVVVTGAPWEAAAMRSIAHSIGGAKTFCGRDLAVLLALVDAADVVLTNDTGPMHLAFALGRPTVAVFTHMSPAVWGPIEASDQFVVLRPPEHAAAGQGGQAWIEVAAADVRRLMMAG